MIEVKGHWTQEEIDDITMRVAAPAMLAELEFQHGLAMERGQVLSAKRMAAVIKKARGEK